jgi:hypothetical protein
MLVLNYIQNCLVILSLSLIIFYGLIMNKMVMHIDVFIAKQLHVYWHHIIISSRGWNLALLFFQKQVVDTTTENVICSGLKLPSVAVFELLQMSRC